MRETPSAVGVIARRSGQLARFPTKEGGASMVAGGAGQPTTLLQVTEGAVRQARMVGGVCREGGRCRKGTATSEVCERIDEVLCCVYSLVN